jgi:hypothetical protein
VSWTTVQNAVREAVRLGHFSKEQRPVKGRKSQTNLIRIISREWLTWLERGPRMGFKSFLGLRNLSPTKNYFGDGDGDARGTKNHAAEATEIADRVADIAGIAPKRCWPPGWCGVVLHVQHWLANGWSRDVMLAAARATMARKPEPGPPLSPTYFVPEIARLHADLARPLPRCAAGQARMAR